MSSQLVAMLADDHRVRLWGKPECMPPSVWDEKVPPAKGFPALMTLGGTPSRSKPKRRVSRAQLTTLSNSGLSRETLSNGFDSQSGKIAKVMCGGSSVLLIGQSSDYFPTEAEMREAGMLVLEQYIEWWNGHPINRAALAFVKGSIKAGEVDLYGSVLIHRLMGLADNVTEYAEVIERFENMLLHKKWRPPTIASQPPSRPSTPRAGIGDMPGHGSRNSRQGGGSVRPSSASSTASAASTLGFGLALPGTTAAKRKQDQVQPGGPTRPADGTLHGAEHTSLEIGNNPQQDAGGAAGLPSKNGQRPRSAVRFQLNPEVQQPGLLQPSSRSVSAPRQGAAVRTSNDRNAKPQATLANALGQPYGAAAGAPAGPNSRIRGSAAAAPIPVMPDNPVSAYNRERFEVALGLVKPNPRLAPPPPAPPPPPPRPNSASRRRELEKLKQRLENERGADLLHSSVGALLSGRSSAQHTSSLTFDKVELLTLLLTSVRQRHPALEGDDSKVLNLFLKHYLGPLSDAGSRNGMQPLSWPMLQALNPTLFKVRLLGFEHAEGLVLTRDYVLLCCYGNALVSATFLNVRASAFARGEHDVQGHTNLAVADTS